MCLLHRSILSPRRLLLHSIFAFLFAASVSAHADYYVSPTGSDSNTGTLEAPFATVAKARDMVRAIAPALQNDITIYLRGGRYLLTEPLTFTPADSGANGHYVVYRAYQNEKPVLSGGIPITGWALHDAALNIWKASAPGINTRQLYVNGRRATRARSDGGLTGAVKTDTGYTMPDASIASWGNQSDIEFAYKNDWMLSRIGVASIDGTSITMKEPAWTLLTKRGWLPGDYPYFIENAYELLDAEGEWYPDRTAGVFYYKPLAGEDMASAEVIAPVLERLVSIEGTLDAPVHHIRFQGLTFSHATWLLPNGNEGFVEAQAATRITANPSIWQQMSGLIKIGAGKNLIFERNLFTHLGAVGLDIQNGSQDNLITGNEFLDISATAIQLGNIDNHHPTDPRDVVKDNTVRSNYIHDIAVEYWGGCGITSFYTDHTVIDHNEIAHLPYSGISCGWGWGGTDNPPSINRDNQITNNHVHHVMQKMFDGGCLYMQGSQPGTLIEGNYFHDQPSFYGMLYFDAACRYMTARRNVLHSGAMNHLVRMDDDYVEYNFWDSENSDGIPLILPNRRALGDGNWIMAHSQYVGDLKVMPASIIRNAGVEPEYADLVPTTPPQDTTPPTAPTGLRVVEVLEGAVRLAWNDNLAVEAVCGYEIYCDGKIIGVSAAAQFTAAGLTPETTYVFAVRARDEAANLSNMSDGLSAKTAQSSGNIALGKSLYCWSADGWPVNPYNGHSIDQAVDGLLETYAEGKNAWGVCYIQNYVLDLLASYDLRTIVLVFPHIPVNDRDLFATDFTIKASTDGAVWQDLQTIHGCQGGRIEISVEKAEARYIAICVLAPSDAGQTGDHIALAEFQVFQQPKTYQKSVVLFSDTFSSGTIGMSIDGKILNNQLGGIMKASWIADANTKYDIHTTSTQPAASGSANIALADYATDPARKYALKMKIDPAPGYDSMPDYKFGYFGSPVIAMDPSVKSFWDTKGITFRIFNDSARNSMSPYMDVFYNNTQQQKAWSGGVSLSLADIDADGFFPVEIGFTGAGTSENPLTASVFLNGYLRKELAINDLSGGSRVGFVMPYGGMCDDFSLAETRKISAGADGEWLSY